MKHYSDIIIAPVITEKSMANRQNNVYTFKVVKDATKEDIKRAEEEAFKVSVKRVNKLNTKSKKRKVAAGRFVCHIRYGLDVVRTRSFGVPLCLYAFGRHCRLFRRISSDERARLPKGCR